MGPRPRPRDEALKAAADKLGRQLADVRLRVARSQPGVPHHLLAVVRPSLRERVGDEHGTELVRRPVGVQELDEVPRPHFVHTDKQQVGRLGLSGKLLNCPHVQPLGFVQMV